MKLSVVIPVYNVGATLNRCLESIVSQKFRDYEVWLIDDGSTDCSSDLCDDWVEKDKRIHVVHQANGGLSDARNRGIRKSHGEYITFIDSDDFIADNTLGEVMQILAVHPDYDILEYSVYEHYGAAWQKQLRLQAREYDDMDVYWLEGKAYEHSYACNKIYRRELFNNVKYPEGKRFEDVYILPELLMHCQRVATTSKGTYYYTHNPHGITETAQGDAWTELLEAYMKVLSRKDIQAHQGFAAYYAYVLNVQLYTYELTGNAPILPVLPYRSTTKLKLMHLIGLKNLCRIIKIIHRIIPSRR